jgi:hypothetical protein
VKINKQKTISKWQFILATVVVVAAVIAIAIYAYGLLGGAPKESASIDYKEASNDQKKAGESIKKQSVVTNGSKPNTGSDSPAAPIPQENGKAKVDITISSANQNGNVFQIRTVIGVVTSSGTCTLTLSRSGQTTVTKTAEVQATASVSTCKGFDIPIAELSPGAWEANLHFENDHLQADTKQGITVE